MICYVSHRGLLGATTLRETLTYTCPSAVWVEPMKQESLTHHLFILGLFSRTLNLPRGPSRGWTTAKPSSGSGSMTSRRTTARSMSLERYCMAAKTTETHTHTLTCCSCQCIKTLVVRPVVNKVTKSQSQSNGLTFRWSQQVASVTWMWFQR